MESGALSTDEFKTFAKDVILFAHITSRVEGEPYPNLLSEKGFRGFPSLAVMNAEGEIIAKPAGRDVEAFSAATVQAQRYVALTAKEKLDKDEQVELFGLEVGLGKYTFEDARARVAAMTGLDDARKAALAEILLPLEIQSLMPKSRDPAEATKAGEQFLAMMNEGREPKAGQPVFSMFYQLILRYADGKGDAPAFKAALAKLEAEFGSNPRAKSFFDAQHKRLAELEAAAKDE